MHVMQGHFAAGKGDGYYQGYKNIIHTKYLVMCCTYKCTRCARGTELLAVQRFSQFEFLVPSRCSRTVVLLLLLWLLGLVLGQQQEVSSPSRRATSFFACVPAALCNPPHELLPPHLTYAAYTHSSDDDIVASLPSWSVLLQPQLLEANIKVLA